MAATIKFDSSLVSMPCPALNDTVKLGTCTQCPDYDYDRGCLYASGEENF